MTLNNLNKIIKELEYELKFGNLSDMDRSRFKDAVSSLKLVLSDRLGFPLYDDKTPINASEELEIRY